MRWRLSDYGCTKRGWRNERPEDWVSLAPPEREGGNWELKLWCRYCVEKKAEDSSQASIWKPLADPPRTIVLSVPWTGILMPCKAKNVSPKYHFEVHFGIMFQSFFKYFSDHCRMQVILRSFWNHVVKILTLFSTLFGITLGQFSDYFGINLGSCQDQFG